MLWDMCAHVSPLIELRDVSYQAGGQRLLDRVSWRLDLGQSWAVLGPNGSGKTLLLRMIAGKLWPNCGGEILRHGKRLLDLRQLSRRIGWVSTNMLADIPPREPAIDTVVSGRFAQLGLRPLEGDRPQPRDYEDASKCLSQLRCESLANKPFGVLSQGEQQKILLARALTIDPLAIILDEPCCGLDPGAREHFLEILQTLLQCAGAPTLILVTHHVEEIVPELRRVLVIHQGRIVKQGPTRDVVTRETLGSVYGRRPQDLVCHGGRRWPIW